MTCPYLYQYKNAENTQGGLRTNTVLLFIICTRELLCCYVLKPTLVLSFNWHRNIKIKPFFDNFFYLHFGYQYKQAEREISQEYIKGYCQQNIASVNKKVLLGKFKI